jgi:hypothetical protein
MCPRSQSDYTEKAMKISVGSRSGSGGNEPRRLCLGRCSLPVTTVLDQYDEGETHIFDVRVLDGRRFVVRRQISPDQWELIAAYGPVERRKPSLRPVAMLLALIVDALLRKGVAAVRRAGKARGETSSSNVPQGGAPA